MSPALLVLLLLPFAFCQIPIHVSPGINYTNPTKPATFSCNDLDTGIKTSCFNLLALKSYFTNWNTTYRLETCSPQQTWNNCFLNFVYTNGTEEALTPKNISKRDCSSLNGNSSTNGCPPPATNQKQWTAQEYYAALTIYNVQHHMFVWSQAISAHETQKNISLDIEHAPKPLTPSNLLTSIIAKHTINQEADTALNNLIKSTPTPPTAGAHKPTTTTTAEWLPLLVQRLQEALTFAMKDFDAFLTLAKTATYSGNDLATAGRLELAISYTNTAGNHGKDGRRERRRARAR